MNKRSRKTGANSKGQRTPDKKLPSPWYKKVWVVASAVGATGFALGLNGPTILQNIRKIPTEISVTSDQFISWLKEDEKWTGQWSTFPEGIVNMADMKLSDGVDLKISINSKNGEIGGEISTNTICKSVPFDFLLIRGKISGNVAHVTVWDIIDGRTVTFSDLDLIREDNVITVKPISGLTNWFPAGARIGKHPVSDNEFLSKFCNRTPSGTGDQNKARSNQSFEPMPFGKPRSSSQLQR